MPYQVTDDELLEIKERCRDLAKEKTYHLKYLGTNTQLIDYGYSEYGGFCYAEIFESKDSKALYNTTEDKRLFIK